MEFNEALKSFHAKYFEKCLAVGESRLGDERAIFVVAPPDVDIPSTWEGHPVDIKRSGGTTTLEPTRHDLKFAR